MRVAMQRTSGLAPGEAAVALDLAQHLVRTPNFIANEHRTERERQEARNRVPAAYIDIRPDTLLVEAGTRIDDETWAVLEDLDMVAVRFDSTQALARLVLCIVMVGFCAAYIVRLHPQLVEQPAALWLTAMVPVAFVTIFVFCCACRRAIR
jgi:membrane-associated HD superfamily phosphohydrolase